MINNLSITGGNLVMNYNEIRFRSSNDADTRINYTNNNGLDGLYIQGNQGVEIATQIDGTVMTVKDGYVGIGTTSPAYKLDVNSTIRARDVFEAGGQNIIVGNDTYLSDIDKANILGIYGIQDNDRGGIRFGTGGGTVFGYNGNIGIGTTDPQYKLDVRGEAHFCKVRVKYPGWCDHIFEEDHELMPLDTLEDFVKKHKHLPGIPTEAEVLENGLDLGEMNKKLLEKVEELTLYIIEQEKRIGALEAENNEDK